MKKQKLFLFAVVFSLCLGAVSPVQAAELEILRGEEEETEFFLEGSEEGYSVFGEVTGSGDYLGLKTPEEENSVNYQTLVLNEEGSKGRLLLSQRGGGGTGLWLRVKVEGKRIGTGTLSLNGVQLADENGSWVLNPQLADITVKVLPNPLVVELDGETGDNDWYISDVTVTVSDKDAAGIWYDLGEGQQTYTEAFVIQDGEYTLTVSSDDGYGYKKEEVRQVNVDTVAPALAASIQELSWQPENIEVTAGSTDETSGVKEAFWAFSGELEHNGEWNALEDGQTLTMEQEGIWYLHVKAADNAGNEAATVYGPYHKDSVKPEIVFENLCQDQLVVEGIVPEITVTDDRSGIEEITYLLDGEAWSPAEITGKGKHVLTVTAKDLAGNTHTETVEFGIYDCIEVAASAGDVNYTETASFSALALYRGEPLPRAEVEFFLNGESLGVRWTNRDGMAWVHLPMELSPMAAELTVSIPQDDKRFLLATEATTTFTVRQEEAWINYTGEIFVRKGEPLRVSLNVEELWEFRDMRKGDITKAEVCAELYRIEEDCSKTLVDTEVLNPDKRGFVSQEFAAETRWYELKLYFTENSWYTGKEKLVYLVVYEGRVKPDWNGEAWWSPEWKEEDREKPDLDNPGWNDEDRDNPDWNEEKQDNNKQENEKQENNKQENNKQENEKQNDNGKDKNNGKKK